MLHSSSDFDLVPTSHIHVAATRAPLSSLHAMTLHEPSPGGGFTSSSSSSSSSSLFSDSSSDSEEAGIRVRNRGVAASASSAAAAADTGEQPSSRASVQSHYSTNTSTVSATPSLPTSSSFSSSSSSTSSSPDETSSDPCDPVTIDFASSPTKHSPRLTHRPTTPLVQLSPSKIKAISSSSASRSAAHAEEEEDGQPRPQSSSSFQAPLSKSYNSYRAESPPHLQQQVSPSPPAPNYTKIGALLLHWISAFRFYHPGTVVCALLYVALLCLALYVPYGLEAESDQLAAGVSAFGSLSFYLAPSPIYSPFLPSHAQNQLRMDLKNYMCSSWMEAWWPNQGWKSTLVLHGSKNEVPQFNYYKFQQQQQLHEQQAQKASWWPFSFIFADAAAVEPQTGEGHQLSFQHDSMPQQSPSIHQPVYHASHDGHLHHAAFATEHPQQSHHHLHPMHPAAATEHMLPEHTYPHSYHQGFRHPSPHPEVLHAIHSQHPHYSVMPPAASIPHPFAMQAPREYHSYHQPPDYFEMNPHVSLQQHMTQFHHPSQYFSQPSPADASFHHLPLHHEAPFQERSDHIVPSTISSPTSIGAVEQKLKERIERDITATMEKNANVSPELKLEESKPQDATSPPSPPPLVKDEMKSADSNRKEKEKEEPLPAVDSVKVVDTVAEKLEEHTKIQATPAVVDVDAALHSLRQRKPSVDYSKEEDQTSNPLPPPQSFPPPQSPQPSNSMHSPPSHILSFRFWPLAFYMSCSLLMLSLPHLIWAILAANFAISLLILTRHWWKERQNLQSPSTDQSRQNTGFIAFLRSKLLCCRRGTALRSATLHSVAPARVAVPSVVLTTSSKFVWIQALAFCMLCGFPAYLMQKSFVERQRRGKKGL